MIASYWPVGSESWMTPSFDAGLGAPLVAVEHAGARAVAVVAPPRTARAKSAQRVARSRFSAVS